MKQSSFNNQFVALLLLASVLFGSVSSFAQTRRGGGQVAANQKKDSQKECKGGFSGIVTYNRTVKSTEPGPNGGSRSNSYVFQSTIRVRAGDDGNANIYPSDGGISGSISATGTATATMTETTKEVSVTEKDDYCKLTLGGMKDQRRVRCESHFDKQGNAGGTGEVGVSVSFRGNKYAVSLTNPTVNGQWSQSGRGSCSGTCSPDKPFESSDGGMIEAAREERGTETDYQLFDPTNFNHLSGTSTKQDGDETITITWNLSRCAPPLQIYDLSFGQHVYPDASLWQDIDSMKGTTDGNLVKVKAKVFNNGGETAYATVKFSETTSGEQLPNGAVSVAVKPGETRDVEYDWDTSGYAWDDFQKNHPSREIKAEIDGDSATAKIKIIPKPVILVHGLWSNAGAWAEYPTYLKEAHSYAWQGFAVGADPEHGKMNTGDHPGNSGPTNTIFQNAQELAKQIKFVREQTNSWHVDIVAHSMGGLISRQYINTFMMTVYDGKPEVTHLVMLGTPNMGSPCADFVGNIFEFFDQNDMNAMRELRPSVVAEYNKKVTNRKGVKFSILAGIPVPRICQKDVWGDGVVEIQSALYNITDRSFAMRHHLDLTGREDFQSFVLPRLAVGPRGTKREETAMRENQNENNFFAAYSQNSERNDRYGFAKYFQRISYRDENVAPAGDDSGLQDVTTRQKIELPAKAVKEIDIPVKDGAAAGIVLVASSVVSAVLTDANGTKLGESKGGTDAVEEMFRTIAVEKTVTNGAWKLKLENLGSESETIFVGGFVNSADELSNFTVAAGKPTPTGQVSLTAKWTTNGSPVTNAKIIGTVVGQNSPLEFFDDGNHSDGTAGDGIYGALIEKIGAGEYYVEASATANNQTKTAVVNFNIGDTTSPVKATAPASKPSVAGRKAKRN